jgi:hypothetical protein
MKTRVTRANKKTKGMHSLWVILLTLVSFGESGRTWYQVLDQHLRWPEDQQHCKVLVQQFDSMNPLEALKCIINHSKVRKIPTLKTGMVHCTRLIAGFKPERWDEMVEKLQLEIIHCIVDRILTHELAGDFTSEEEEEETFAGHNVLVWKRKREDL